MMSRFSERMRHKHMISALGSHMALDPDDDVEIRDYKAAGVRRRLCDDGSYRGEDRGRFAVTLRVERFDYPSYSQDYWTLCVEGLGALAGFDKLHTSGDQYFGGLANAYMMVREYRLAERGARGEPDVAERVRTHIDGLFARARAASEAISGGIADG